MGAAGTSPPPRHHDMFGGSEAAGRNGLHRGERMVRSYHADQRLGEQSLRTDFRFNRSNDADFQIDDSVPQRVSILESFRTHPQ